MVVIDYSKDEFILDKKDYTRNINIMQLYLQQTAQYLSIMEDIDYNTAYKFIQDSF